MLTIEGFNTKRVLIDNGSSASIMYMTAYQQLRLNPKRLRPFESVLKEIIFTQGHYFTFGHNGDTSYTDYENGGLFVC